MSSLWYLAVSRYETIDIYYNSECWEGTYQPEEGKGSCLQCPAGTHCNMTGLPLPNGNCSAGSFSAEGALACTSCAAGSYQPEEGKGSCLQCLAGTCCGSSGLVALLGICKPGLFSSGGSIACQFCMVGYYSPLICSSACFVCDVGFISRRGDSSCQRILHPPIIFTLHGLVDSFTESSERRASFLFLLVEKLSLSNYVEHIIVSVRSGSVIVELVFYQHHGSTLLISDVVARMRASFRFGHFDSIGVEGLTIGDETISKSESAVFSLLAIILISTFCFLII